METFKVKLGSKAYTFHDSYTGITVCKGEIKELTAYQLNSKRVKSALASGHLVYSYDEIKEPKTVEDTNRIKNLKSKFESMYKSGTDESKLEKSFNLSDLKLIAKEFDVIPDEGDTKADLVKAIIEEIDSDSEEK